MVTIASIRRYPVKSMGGEGMAATEIDRRGLAGDRWFAVEDADGHFASGKNTRRFRRSDAVFDHRATTTSTGVQVSCEAGAWRVGETGLDAHLTSVMGTNVRVSPEAGISHVDAAAVSLVGTATLAWCAERWGVDADPRRLRVNLVVATETPFVEEGWVGSTITVGEAVLRVDERAVRCRMVDLSQDGAAAEGPWLRPLGAERDLCLAVYASVEQPGRCAVGDPVRRAG